MKNILKIVESLKDFVLLIISVSEKMKNEAKEKKGGFLAG